MTLVSPPSSNGWTIPLNMGVCTVQDMLIFLKQGKEFKGIWAQKRNFTLTGYGNETNFSNSLYKSVQQRSLIQLRMPFFILASNSQRYFN